MVARQCKPSIPHFTVNKKLNTSILKKRKMGIITILVNQIKKSSKFKNIVIDVGTYKCLKSGKGLKCPTLVEF